MQENPGFDFHRVVLLFVCLPLYLQFKLTVNLPLGTDYFVCVCVPPQLFHSTANPHSPIGHCVRSLRPTL